jgi:phytoene dehydrogenase-like protein
MKHPVLTLLWLSAIFTIPSYAGSSDCDLALQEARPAPKTDAETIQYLSARYGVEPGQIQFTEKDHYPIIIRGVDEAALVPSTEHLPVVVDPKVHDVVVVGGGPAGLTSALYLTDVGKEVIVIDPNERLGGLGQGSTLSEVRAGTGAAYASGPDNIDEYKIFQHIGAGDYKKKLSITEPIDSLSTREGDVALDIWSPENMGSKNKPGKLPASFAVFKRMLRHLVQGDTYYDLSSDTGKMLDNTWAADWINAMPQELAKLKDSNSKSIYQRFLNDPRVDKNNPMKDVVDLMNRYCRSALGGTSHEVSAFALVRFYEEEMSTRYTGTYGTGEIVEKILAKLKEPARAITTQTRAAVTKIIDTAEGSEIHYVKEGKEYVTRARAVVFGAPLKLAPKIIDRFAEMAPEAYEAANSLKMTNYAVHVVRTKGHPLRETYDLWLAGMNDAAADPTDVISSRWQDPTINGFEGMRDFRENPDDDKGAIAIYQPLGAPSEGGLDSKEAMKDAERSLDLVKARLNPYLRRKFGVDIQPELIESNRWPYSIHVAAKGWMERAQVFRQPVGHIYFANNNMGLPEFEKTLVFGKQAAEKIIQALKRGPASVRAPASVLQPDSRYVKASETCEVKSPSKLVYFFKQWHLSPSVNTNAGLSKSMEAPQHDNQTAIYRQLDQWLTQNMKFDLVAEGCPAPREIGADSPEKFNGWSVGDLREKAATEEYADLVTNVGYKIEAKWKDHLKVKCGDDDAEIKKGSLAFSDARALVGYITRLEEYKSQPERAQIYLDGVIDLYKLPKQTTIPQALARLNIGLKRALGDIERSIQVRNQKLVEAVAADSAGSVAVVFGGVHAAGVRKLLEEKGIGCQILEPQGYEDNEVKMLETLHSLIDRRVQQAS